MFGWCRNERKCEKLLYQGNREKEIEIKKDVIDIKAHISISSILKKLLIFFFVKSLRIIDDNQSIIIIIIQSEISNKQEEGTRNNKKKTIFGEFRLQQV